jgi:hypothetical protein
MQYNNNYSTLKCFKGSEALDTGAQTKACDRIQRENECSLAVSFVCILLALPSRLYHLILKVPAVGSIYDLCVLETALHFTRSIDSNECMLCMWCSQKILLLPSPEIRFSGGTLWRSWWCHLFIIIIFYDIVTNTDFCCILFILHIL